MKKPNRFKLDAIRVVAIKRTQEGRSSFEAKTKIFRHFQSKKKKKDIYDVQIIGFTEGPIVGSTSAGYMKTWPDEA